jgi:hypothetical protein
MVAAQAPVLLEEKCPLCGKPLSEGELESRVRVFCPDDQCGFIFYQNPIPAAGAIIVENVFVLPGIGRLVFQAIANRDMCVVRDVVLLLAAMVIAINFTVDVLYAMVDPRLSRRGV